MHETQILHLDPALERVNVDIMHLHVCSPLGTKIGEGGSVILGRVFAQRYIHPRRSYFLGRRERKEGEASLHRGGGGNKYTF